MSSKALPKITVFGGRDGRSRRSAKRGDAKTMRASARAQAMVQLLRRQPPIESSDDGADFGAGELKLDIFATVFR